jgi:LacI family transcriptional regulator
MSEELDAPLEEVIEPSLTTIKQPHFEMGKVATTLLINQIKNISNIKKNNTQILEPQLIIRDSSIKTKPNTNQK